MQKGDLAKILSGFLGEYLPRAKGFSPNTIASYSDTFRILLQYCADVKGLKPEKMCVKDFSADMISEFLSWLEDGKGCSVSTRNQRLAALSSFAKYAMLHAPWAIGEMQEILMLPYKRNEKREVGYIRFDDMAKILLQPDVRKNDGRRDRILLGILYDTGARVSELIDITIGDVRLDAPASIKLHGKGMKVRSVPLTDEMRGNLHIFMDERSLLQDGKQMNPLFCNHKGEKFTRAGITYIVKKYVSLARRECPAIPKSVTPHMFRHSKAMHLLQAGVNIVYIKDILGHSDIATTQVYVKADMDMKREALEKAKITMPDTSNLPPWATDRSLMEWLSTLGKMGKH